MRALFDPHIHSEPWWKSLLKTHAHTEPNHSCQAAVRYRRRDFNQNGSKWRRGIRRKRGDVDVGEVDHCKRAEGERVFRVGNGGNEVCECTRSFSGCGREVFSSITCVENFSFAMLKNATVP